MRNYYVRLREILTDTQYINENGHTTLSGNSSVVPVVVIHADIVQPDEVNKLFIFYKEADTTNLEIDAMFHQEDVVYIVSDDVTDEPIDSVYRKEMFKRMNIPEDKDLEE